MRACESLPRGRAVHVGHEREQLRRRFEAHEFTGGDVLDAPDEEVSALIGPSPELHHERALRRKGQFRSCTGAVRRLVLHAERIPRNFLGVRRKP